MNEQWKDIIGYVGMYRISSLGRVMSLPRLYVKQCRILLTYPHKDGYVFVNLSDSVHRRKMLSCMVHRLVATHFLPNPCSLPEVNHIDFDRTNNSVSNLEWVTTKGNALHSLKAGRTFGLKIDLGKANMIRQKYQTGHYTQISIAEEFGIGQDEISRIVNNKIWEGK